MSSNTILGYTDGWLCALETDTRSAEPVADTLYWPLIMDRKQHWEEDLGKELHRSSGGLSYILKIGGWWKEFHLPQRGQTKALRVESAPVPKPKGLRKATETRWYYGRWQKYSQQEGWINA